MATTAPDIQIAPADLGDPDEAAAVVAILDAYAREPAGGGRPLPPGVRDTLIAGLAARPHAMVLLARCDGAAAGAAVCFEGYSTFAARPLINIHDLAVLPAFRGRGIGSALLEAVEAVARARDCCRVTLEVLDSNPRARKLYERIGFRDPAPADGDATRFMVKPV